MLPVRILHPARHDLFVAQIVAVLQIMEPHHQTSRRRRTTNASLVQRTGNVEKTAELIDKEVNKIVEEQYERAKDILKKYIEGMKKLAEQLLEKEVIFSEDLEKIFGKRK